MAKSKKIYGLLEELEYEDLVEVVRGKSRRKRQESAYNEIEKRIKLKIMQIARGFYINGFNFDDILQESLYALRFKAIPDYKKNKGAGGTSYPFDKFAALCVRRHLSTIRKSSYQTDKKKTLNISISLDQDRNSSNDESLFLSDILFITEETISDQIEQKEYCNILYKKLLEKLSKFERGVFLLYTKKYSYDEIADKINLYYKAKGSKKKIKIKSIDNAISRIKIKGKEIFDKYGD